MRRLVVGILAIALVATACGAPSPAPRSDPTTIATPGSTLSPRTEDVLACDETPLVTADPSLYEDTPKYVGNEMPVEAVRSWASQYPEFVDVWIDREHNGWVTAGFTGDVTKRQAEIEKEFPDAGVVAVEIGWTESDLAQFHEEVVAALGSKLDLQGSWTDPLRGYVGLLLPVLSDEASRTIAARFPGERICVEGLEPEDVVAPGPQPKGGDGWRLLVDEDGVGEVYRTGIAWDRESLAGLLQGIPGLGDVDLDVDFNREIVVWFGAVHGSSCPSLRLDDVLVTGDLVHAEIVNTDNEMACTADALPHTYVVAVDRSRLPEPPFYVSLGVEPIGGDRLRVQADLTEPGSGARPEQIGPDPGATDRPPEGSGVIIEPGFPWEYTVDLRCGFEAIGEINSYYWVTFDAIPDGWNAAAAEQASVVVQVLLHEGPDPYLEVTFEGETVIFEPTDDAGCWGD